jgi:serine/threonine-protein kinase RsbW
MTHQPTILGEFDPRELKLRLHAVIAADVEAISLFTDQAMVLVREMGVESGKDFDVELALREALANAVMHGCQADPGKQVECLVACDENRGMLVVVRDPGTGFDPAALPSCLNGQNVYSTHGRGVFLINQLMDEVQFENGGTEIRMRKY